MPNPTTPGEAIAGRLLATSGVTALVGTNVYPSKPTQDTDGDYVVYYKSAGSGGLRLDGPTLLRSYTIRIECYSATEAAAEAIIFAVVAALDGWSNPAIGVAGCFAQEDQDETVQDDAAGGVYQNSGQSFLLWFRAV